MKIAVIGSGISGLAACHYLAEHHSITVYESSQKPGGHVLTQFVETPNGPIGLDMGFIVYNERNYPLFNRLLGELNITTHASDMSFGVRNDITGIEYAGRSFDTLFADKRNLLKASHWRMLNDISWFMRDATSQRNAFPDDTVDQFLSRHDYSDAFAEGFLLPLGAALWSCPTQALRNYSVSFVIDFLANHAMLTLKDRPVWRVVTGGSQKYVDRLVATSMAEFRCNRSVDSIVRTGTGIRVYSGSVSETFDEAIIACHSNQALALLKQPTQTETEVLGAIEYQANDVCLHTDDSVMPVNRKAWASWNYHVRGDGASTQQSVVTYNLNLLQGIKSDVTYCVSLNQTEYIDPSAIIARSTLHHPAATVAGVAARKRRAELIRHEGISYCGAYWGYGFHEDGARSGIEVARAFEGTSA